MHSVQFLLEMDCSSEYIIDGSPHADLKSILAYYEIRKIIDWIDQTWFEKYFLGFEQHLYNV